MTVRWAPSWRISAHSLLLSVTCTTAERTFVDVSCLPERDASSLGAPDTSEKPHDPRSSQHVTSKRWESHCHIPETGFLKKKNRCEHLKTHGCLMLMMWLSLPEDGYLLVETCKGISGRMSAVHKHVNAPNTCQLIQSLNTIRTAALFHHRNNKRPPNSNTMSVK